MNSLDSDSHIMRAALPYVPGFLCFREGAPATKAVRCLDPKPTLLFVDGCGVNHPRMAGLACNLGIILGVPTIGISKDALCGEYGNFLEKKDGKISQKIEDVF